MEIGELWRTAIGSGIETGDLTPLQMGFRAVIVYVLTLTILRVAKKRFLGRATAFDVVVGIIVGSIASRAVTGHAPLAPSMTAALAIVLMHWLFSALAVRSHGFGRLIKGCDTLLVEDGKVDHRSLKAAHMSDRDLAEALREKGLREVGEVAEARLERDGSVSIIKRS